MTLLRLMVLMGMSLATLPCDWCQNNVAMPLGSPGGGDHFRISQMEEEMVDLGDDGDVSTLIQDLIVLASKRIQILQPLEQIDPDVINRFVNNEAILKHLSAESKELIRDLLAKDLANWNIFKSFRRTSLQVVRDKNDLDPVLVNVLSFVAPILGNLSAKCRKQTRIWLQRLVTLQKGDPLWPIKFLDFSGKIPTGIFADVIKFGEMAVPFGNHIAFGSYEGCLGIHETDDETNITIDGRSTMLRLTTELDVGVSNDEALEQLLNDLAEADLSNVQSGNTLNVAHAIRARELRDKYLWDQVGIVQLVVGIMGMRWGLCTPSGCSVEDITQSFNALLENFKVANVSLAVAADSSHTKNSIEQVYDAGTIIFILILSILGLLILATTALDVYSKLKPFPSDDDDRTTLVQIIKCFSLDANGRKVLSSKAGGSNHLGCLGGIRTLSMLWVILAHTFLGPIMLMPALVNRFYAYQLIWTYFGWSMELISNAAPSVDTFFLMSGTLVSYLTFIQLERKQFSLWMYYIHRYIRLTIPYAFCIGLAIWIFPLVSFGPFAHVFDATFTSHCRDNWYLNLLYINNFFEEERMVIN